LYFSGKVVKHVKTALGQKIETVEWLTQKSNSTASIMPGCKMPNDNHNLGWNEKLFYQEFVFF
jgi:hypothetical protein